MKNNIGILFDFNGTLLFDSDKHEKAWHIFIEKLCKRVITADEFQHEVHGRTNDVIIKHFTGKTDLSAADIQKYSDEKESCSAVSHKIIEMVFVGDACYRAFLSG